MNSTILVVDDDELFRRALAFSLEENGYRVHTSNSAEDALQFARLYKCDLVLLDICLPGVDGYEAIRRFNRMNAPVMYISAKRRPIDESLGLRLGAVDYITKPYNLDVLLARIHNALCIRQQSQGSSLPEKIQIRGFTIDPEAHVAKFDGIELKLTPREFALLYKFTANPNIVISVNNLLSSIWGAEFIGQPQVLYTHIRWLRQKIEPEPSKPKFIVTVRNVGYKFLAPETEP
jgi:DNA-binding response OmpR family regulator